MKFNPLRNLCVVKLDEGIKMPEKTESGLLYLPTDGKSRPSYMTGTVEAVGPGKRHPKKCKIIPMPEELQPGAKVAFGYYIGTIFFAEGNEYRVLSDDQVLGICEA